MVLSLPSRRPGREPPLWSKIDLLSLPRVYLACEPPPGSRALYAISNAQGSRPRRRLGRLKTTQRETLLKRETLFKRVSRCAVSCGCIAAICHARRDSTGSPLQQASTQARVWFRHGDSVCQWNIGIRLYCSSLANGSAAKGHEAQCNSMPTVCVRLHNTTFTTLRGDLSTLRVARRRRTKTLGAAARHALASLHGWCTHP